MTAHRLVTHLEEAVGAFANRFGHMPTLAAMAPGRVNLIGEHTDYNDGFVMPLAIDRHTFVLARPASQRHSTLWARDLDDEIEIDLSSPLSPGGGRFADYVLAVVDQFKRRGTHIQPLELMVTGDIPRGAGLSSSAALEVATATLLDQVSGRFMSPKEKALLCQAAEQEFVGVPCGIMDMFIISMAKRQTAMMIDCRSLEHQAVPMPSSRDAKLLVVDTGVERSLRSGDYAARRRTCAAAAQKLGLQSLRDAAPDQVEGSTQLTAIERSRALHVVHENQRVTAGARALGNADLKRFGELMFASHDSLRVLYQVSIAELDAVVDAARSMTGRGVFGARMTGAGFGGCAIVLSTADEAQAVIQHIQRAFSLAFGREPVIFEVSAVDGARAVSLGPDLARSPAQQSTT